MQPTQQSYAESEAPADMLRPGIPPNEISFMYWPAVEPNSDERGAPARLLAAHDSKKVAVATAATAVTVDVTVVVSRGTYVVSVSVDVVL